MKQTLKAVLWSASLLLALQMGAMAQAVSVPVPIDTSKIVATVAVKVTFKDAAGTWWEASGDLNVKPIPPPPPVNASLPPSVFDSSWTGTRLVLLGSGFGSEPGLLQIDWWDTSAIQWSDGIIAADAERKPAAYTVVTSKGDWYTGVLIERVAAP